MIADTPHVTGVPFVTIDDRTARARPRSTCSISATGASRSPRSGSARTTAPASWTSDRRDVATYRVTRERLRGYAEAITAAGFDWDAVPVYEGHPNSRALGAEAISALLALDPPPTALLAMSDEIAIGAIDGANAAGLAVPGQLSVVGFDDAPAATPRGLTTIRQPLVDKGRAAGRMLLEAIEGGTPADVTLPTELVVRGSTAPLRR